MKLRIVVEIQEPKKYSTKIPTEWIEIDPNLNETELFEKFKELLAKTRAHS